MIMTDDMRNGFAALNARESQKPFSVTVETDHGVNVVSVLGYSKEGVRMMFEQIMSATSGLWLVTVH